MSESRTLKLACTAALVLVLPNLAGCETIPHPPMTYEACAAARLCTIQGTISAQQSGQAWMGRLDLADGRCVAVSLPADLMLALQEGGPRPVTVRGQVHEVPDPDTVSMTVEGRTIGLGLCGNNFILFVLDDAALIYG